MLLTLDPDDLPQREFREVLSRRLQRLGGTARDHQGLESLVKSLDPAHVPASSRLEHKPSHLKAGTVITFSRGRCAGSLLECGGVQASLDGVRLVSVGESDRLHAALFDLYLGSQEPVSEEAMVQAGRTLSSWLRRA